MGPWFNELVAIIVWISLAAHVVMVVVCIWHVLKGLTPLDRLLGLDLTATLTMVILLLAAILSGHEMILNIVIGYAALSYISTVALAKYIADERMF